ncbi:MAG: glycoside hydrolase family protein [Pirellulaceae bacterium]
MKHERQVVTYRNAPLPEEDRWPFFRKGFNLKSVFLIARMSAFLFLVTDGIQAREPAPLAKPPDFSTRLVPRNRILNRMDEGYHVWGCAAIYSPDGRVHVFFAQWRHGGDWKFRPDYAWKLTGSIGHAVADQPEGPYAVLDVALRPRGGDYWDGTGLINPQIYRVGDRYALYFTGINYRQHPQRQGVGLAVSQSLDGPWVRISDRSPIIGVSNAEDAFDSLLCNNPAMVRHPDGRFLLYYKGRNRHAEQKLRDDRVKKVVVRRIGLALADRLEGPYVKYDANPVLDYGPQGKDFEDPYVWRESEMFHLLLHDMNVFEHGGGLYLTSYDGIRWSEPAKGYPSTRSQFGVVQRLETPILLMKDGRPDYLFNNRGGSTGEPIFSGFVWKVRSLRD